MSHRGFKNILKTTGNKLRTLNKDFKQYVTEEKYHGKNPYTIQNLKNAPEYIKKNPFYWGFYLKAIISEQFKYLFKKGPKLLTQDMSSANYLVKITKQKMNKLTIITKNQGIKLYDSVKHLVAVNNFSGLVHSIKPLPIINKINNRMKLFTRKMGGKMSLWNKNFGNYMLKYRDPKINDEYRKQYESNLKRLEEKWKNFNFGGNFFKRGKYKLNTLFGVNLKKMENYINSPNYKQKLYNYEIYLRRFLKKMNITNFNFKNFKMPNLLNPRTFYADLKGSLYKLIIYFSLIVAGFYFIKYSISRIFGTKQDRRMEETLQAVKDLKSQNEKLLKFNQELIYRLEQDKLK
jgi:hypothetical protein